MKIESNMLKLGKKNYQRYNWLANQEKLTLHPLLDPCHREHKTQAMPRRRVLRQPPISNGFN